jgi:hypothetical protein
MLTVPGNVNFKAGAEIGKLCQAFHRNRNGGHQIDLKRKVLRNATVLPVSTTHSNKGR